MWSGSSPSTRELTPLLLRAWCQTRGRRASTRWSCCSPARRSGESHATSCGCAATRRRTMSGCWRRSCCMARRRWPSSRRVRQPATLALPYPPLPPPFLFPLFCSSRLASCWRRRRNCWPGRRWWARRYYTCGPQTAGRVRLIMICRKAGFSHVMGYAASSVLGALDVDTLLDVASHGAAGRRHLLVPAGLSRRRRTGRGAGEGRVRVRSSAGFSLVTVGRPSWFSGPGRWPGLGRIGLRRRPVGKRTFLSY
jgi:hypothetical protein